ncbi:unnamed protein product [Lymnaea stagnalis]|uniref:Uncharacterized protein n=1 Tax=Lymnaea stagnalis TaxID=6523 RepID=A0AAV2H4Z9_LYMST
MDLHYWVLVIGFTLVAADDCLTPTPFEVIDDPGIQFPDGPIECPKANGKYVRIDSPDYCVKNEITPFTDCCAKRKGYECTWDKIQCPGVFWYNNLYCKLIRRPIKLPKYANCSCFQCVTSYDSTGLKYCPLLFGKCGPTALQNIPVSMVCVDPKTLESRCFSASFCLPQRCDCFA